MCRAFIDFKPAQLVETKRETYIAYYVKNPDTGRLERKRVRINHIKSVSERRKYGRLLAMEINDKLYNGWNPFVDGIGSGGPNLNISIGEFIREKSKDLRKDSMRSYNSFSKILIEWCAAHGLGDKPCSYFDENAAKRFMADMERMKGLSAKTYNNYLTFYNILFNCFKDSGRVLSNPFANMHRKKNDGKLRDVIPHDVRAMVADYFIRNNMREFLIVMQICYRLFVRPKEIMLSRIEFINFDESLLVLPPDVTKNHKKRVLGVPDEIMSYFRTLKGMNPSYYIFSDGYKPGPTFKDSRYCAKTWAKMREKLGLPIKFQFYSLKDSGITEMLEAGVPAKYVKELAGHHSLEMTEKYTHKSDAKKILEYNKLEF